MVLDEIKTILWAQAKSYIQVELPADLRAQLDRLGQQSSDLDEAVERIDELLEKLDALEGVRQSIQSGAQATLSPEDIRKAIDNAPDARSRLDAALARAARTCDDRDPLLEVIEAARKALADGDDARLAESLKTLLDDLATRTGERVDRLKAMRAELAALKQRAEQQPGYEEGVTRVLIAGARPAPTAADDPSLPLFPPDAVLKARTALESGDVPPRYRWVVERYFSQGIVPDE